MLRFKVKEKRKEMLTEYDSELLSKNRPHKCNDYTIYFSLSRGWELCNNYR